MTMRPAPNWCGPCSGWSRRATSAGSWRWWGGSARRCPDRIGCEPTRGGTRRRRRASPFPRGGGCDSRQGGPLPTRPARTRQDRRQPGRGSSAPRRARSQRHGAGRQLGEAARAGAARHAPHPPTPGGSRAHHAGDPISTGLHPSSFPPPLPRLTVTALPHPTRAGAQRPWPCASVAVGRTSGLWCAGSGGEVAARTRTALPTNQYRPFRTLRNVDSVLKIFPAGNATCQNGK